MLLGSLLHQVFEQVSRADLVYDTQLSSLKVLMNFRGDSGDITNMKDHVIQLIHDTVNTFPTIMSM